MEFNKITEKITLPIAIVISAAILAIAFFFVQYGEQNSTAINLKQRCSEDARVYIESLGDEKSLFSIRQSAYSKDLNTCLVEYHSSAFLPGGVGESNVIYDLYANKKLIYSSFFDPNEGNNVVNESLGTYKTYSDAVNDLFQ